MIIPVILEGDMLWVYHLQTVKEFVKRAYIAVIVLTHFACP